jgi:hypothetical protein
VPGHLSLQLACGVKVFDTRGVVEIASFWQPRVTSPSPPDKIVCTAHSAAGARCKLLQWTHAVHVTIIALPCIT